jgi:DNA-binding transcriptional ArsR family regulator
MESATNATVATELWTMAKMPMSAHIPRVEGVGEIAEVAALVGDPARANMLCALLDGRALTASELAYSAGVSPQTASGHLGKLANAKLLELVKQGRHRYYRLSGAHVGRMLESIMDVAVTGPPRYRPHSKLENELRKARTCYDHLAGRLGVGIAAHLCSRGHLILVEEGGTVTSSGEALLTRLGVDLAKARAGRRVLCRPCLDWTERRPHIGGAVGAALASRCFELGWIERMRNKRGLRITPAGERGLLENFDLSL